jgi:hypothetical protein
LANATATTAQAQQRRHRRRRRRHHCPFPSDVAAAATALLSFDAVVERCRLLCVVRTAYVVINHRRDRDRGGIREKGRRASAKMADNIVGATIRENALWLPSRGVTRMTGERGRTKNHHLPASWPHRHDDMIKK